MSTGSPSASAAGLADATAPEDPFTGPERRALAAMVADFTYHHIAPHMREWERQRELPRSLHREAGELGLLGLSYPESVGGSGGDLVDVAIMTETILTHGGSGGLVAALFTHGIAIPHVIDAAHARRTAGDEAGAAALIDTIIRPTLAGDQITALGVTEPDGGSDVGALRTRATPLGPDGEESAPDDAVAWRLDGAKAYITSGARADTVVVAARAFGPGAGGIALFAVPTSSAGFEVVSRMGKMGWHCSDTAELALSGVEVPASHLLTPGTGAGFASLARHFATERISLAITSYATAQRCLDLTVAWTKDRVTFGRPLITRQVVRHQLVEMHRQVDVARTYTHALIADIVSGRVADPTQIVLRAALAKNTAVAAVDSVVDQAVQLHGGYGFLSDSEVEMHYRDAKVLGIGGGATEVMTDLAAKLLGW